jgi:hypothetical protein
MASDEFHQNLINKLVRAPEDQLRSILKSLCAEKAAGKKAVALYTTLLTEKKSTQKALKRKASEDVEFCLVCEEPFSEKENKKDAKHMFRCLSYES